MRMIIRAFKPADFPAVKAIYQQGIDSGHATFQQQAGDWDEWNRARLPECRLVAQQGDRVIGWAALSPASSRCVYAGVAEVSVYVATKSTGGGLGGTLLAGLISASEQHGIWTLVAGIFPENAASLQMHRKHGFKILGRREKLGQMRGVWRDVLLLERRSNVVGV